MKNMIASQKKGNVEMGLNYHNLMEDIVLQHVDRILEADGCCCDICKSDVMRLCAEPSASAVCGDGYRAYDGQAEEL